MTTPRRQHRLPRILLLFLAVAVAVMLPAVGTAGAGVPAMSHADCPLTGPDCPDSAPHGSESRHCGGCLPATAAALSDPRLPISPRTGCAAPPFNDDGPLRPGHRQPQLRPPRA